MSYRPPLRGPPIGGQDNDGVSLLCSAPYTLSRFAGLPLKGKRENRWHWILYIVSHMIQTANPVTPLASPLGEEGHEVAKGCTGVRMIMILDVDVTAEGGIIKLIAREGDTTTL